MNKLELKNNEKYNISEKQVINVILRISLELKTTLLFRNKIFIIFGGRETSFNWDEDNTPIYIGDGWVYSLYWKISLVHELVHLIDYLKEGRWNTSYLRHYKKSRVKYFSDIHEQKAEDIAQRLYGDESTRKIWNMVKTGTYKGW